ncbi:hypothetical protein L1286_01030 [Pseudoalteromonas sp. SMS1]|uniref:hypothetical protein n=1 Tax=Pseudoalteromonas sp. SMS1 TaxID=2908894 RepID=UPI001F1F23AB|nr:hypothetical protein [Pseudoalteromonas sp. SMS1]MCF2856041.1 hypothetical protein [Pseudoalteromonas sp. SMS1]
MIERRNRVCRTDSASTQYLEKVIAVLKAEPHKISILKRNCEYYQKQQFLKKGFQRAIEHMQWLLAVDDDVERICNHIMAEDYIGNKLRQYPLLFKGVTTL